MKIVVSLTTISDRQRQCSRTLKSILEQTRVPDEIRLYVSSKPFLLDKGIRPYCFEPVLHEFLDKHKEIIVEWVENTGPYRKLLPALKKYWQQDILLLTCDDDVVYKNDFVQRAEELYEQHHCCIGFMGTRIKNTFNYKSFEDAKGTKHLWNLAKGCAGIVYSPLWFHNTDIFQWKDFPTCDDLWFAAWRIAEGIECYLAEETSMGQSLSSGKNLWVNYNETTNADYLEKVLHLFCYKGWIQDHTFFSEESKLLFQWNKYIQDKLLPHIGEEQLEGNIWSKNFTKVPDMTLLAKQKNILWLAKQVKGTDIMEVGFNAGFSAVLCLMSNPNLHLLGVDLGEHDYAKKCAEIIQNDFPSRVTVLFGDSRTTLPTLLSKTFDMIHIDGGHSEEVARSDVGIGIKLLKPTSYFLLDDTNLGDVQKAITKVSDQLKEISLPYPCGAYKHSLYQLS